MLLSLPAEILNDIAQYLTVKDLLSCSLTCSRLRAVFNDNIIWRKFLRKNIINYIESKKRKNSVDYNISALTCDLDPICDERIHYIQQNQLLNNWKNGKFVEHEAFSQDGLYYMSLKSGTPIIYEDIYLFLYDFYEHTIMVWNIRNSPFTCTSIKLLYQNYFYEGLQFEIVGNKLVVYEVGKFVQIYDINLPNKHLPLSSLILVDQNEPLEKIPDFHSPDELYAVCYHKIIENKLYSHKLGKPILHIWNIETGRKVEALKPPKDGINFNVMSASKNGNDLVLCLEINDHQRKLNALGRIYEVLTYSFSKNLFKTVWTNTKSTSCTYIPFHAIQHEDLIIVFCRLHNLFTDDTSLPKTVLVLYDYKWAMVIGEKSFPELVCHRQTKVFDNQLILATAFCIYKLDLCTQEVVYSFKFEHESIELLNVFDGKFVITTPKPLVSVSRTKRKEVWDIQNRRRCMLLTYVFTSAYSKDSVFVNKSFTKIVVVGKGTLGVLNLW